MTNNLPIKHHQTAGCVLVDSLGKDANILLIFRKWTHAPSGAYILPKGHIEEGENPAGAAVRETTEETGYTDLKIVTELTTTKIRYEAKGFDNHKTIHWYLTILTDKTTQKPAQLTETELESSDFRLEWCPITEAIKKLQDSPLDAEKEVIGHLHALLS